LVESRGHRDVVAAALRGGADCIQLRAPELSDCHLLPLAAEVLSTCRQAGRLCVVNDRLEVAVTLAADGVHLGQGDRPERARASLARQIALGVSVGTPEQARQAEAFGATYLGVTVFASRTKPGARPVGLGGLRAICVATRLPVLGIGGIDASNAVHVLEAGACGIAVVSAVGAADDMIAAAAALRSAVDAAIGRADPRRNPAEEAS
jgi:thiamine-phosphate diphosphorylase